MPPVFGPVVAVEDALVVLRRGQRERALAVAQREQRQLLAVEELLDDAPGASPKRRSTSIVVERRARLAPRPAAITTPLPAASPSALITAG